MKKMEVTINGQPVRFQITGQQLVPGVYEISAATAKKLAGVTVNINGRVGIPVRHCTTGWWYNSRY